MSDSIWLAVIGVISLIIKEYFDRLRANDAALRVEAVRIEAAIAAEKVKGVAKTLSTEQSKQTSHIIEVSKQIEEIHKATNGMKAELVAEVRAASYAKGVKSETDKK